MHPNLLGPQYRAMTAAGPDARVSGSVYASSQRLGCFIETLARFRVDIFHRRLGAHGKW